MLNNIVFYDSYLLIVVIVYLSILQVCRNFTLIKHHLSTDGILLQPKS